MRIAFDRQQIAAFARRHAIRRLSFFGSVLRDDFGPDSDVDVLVAFEADARVGLIALAAMEIELGNLLGRRVELHTEAGLHPAFRDQVLAGREVLYEQA